MYPIEFRKNIFSVGAIDWNRRLFDELIPLPDGTSYNSYLIKGSEKIALIDTVDPTKKEVLFNNLKSLNINHIDYVIANHAEQDHSGSIPFVLDAFPDAKVVCSSKCKEILTELLLIPPDKFMEVKDGEFLSLGDRTLEFITYPWVHWPETILTYLIEDKILFPCDFFGSHLASNNLYVQNEELVLESAKRYYAEIMMPFRTVIRNNFSKLDKYDIDLIAPSHGPIYSKPELIINAYKDWTSDNVKNEVVIVYVSMHQSTEKMVEYIVNALTGRNISVKQFCLPNSDIGKIAISLVDAATIILGTPTILGGAHPYALFATALVNALRPKTKFASIIGSYAWGGKTIEQVTGMLSSLKVEVLSPVLAKGYPKEGDYKALENLANTISEKHKGLSLI
ncbi:MAG TPA: FprA family A-type flavoprotein [Caldisericia bacterium]|nr:FprA family A-type flavoprotein [Caldisericia bacterium]HPO28497.1 FprA family A-type flavoprotein [Caldisericia bacterium]